jgi:uncharacterized membrane protein YjjP (DUF1212 family)
MPSEASCEATVLKKLHARPDDMERVFQVAAVILAGAAAYFFWAGNQDGLYVCAVMGCVAFFLSIRVQVKRRNDIREAAIIAAQDAEDVANKSVPPA